MNGDTLPPQGGKKGGMLIWIIIIIIAAAAIWWWMSDRAVAPESTGNDTTSAINEDLTAITLETVDTSEIDADINSL